MENADIAKTVSELLESEFVLILFPSFFLKKKTLLVLPFIVRTTVYKIFPRFNRGGSTSSTSGILLANIEFTTVCVGVYVHPTNNALDKLPTELQCRNLVSKHRLSIQMCMPRVHIPTQLPFCIPPLLVGHDVLQKKKQLFNTVVHTPLIGCLLKNSTCFLFFSSSVPRKKNYILLVFFYKFTTIKFRVCAMFFFT